MNDLPAQAHIIVEQQQQQQQQQPTATATTATSSYQSCDKLAPSPLQTVRQYLWYPPYPPGCQKANSCVPEASSLQIKGVKKGTPVSALSSTQQQQQQQQQQEEEQRCQH